MEGVNQRPAQHAHPPESSSSFRLRPGVTDELFALPDASSGCESTLQDHQRELGYSGIKRTYSSLMVFAIIVNASSTFVEFLAEVSMNGIDKVSANS